MSSRTTNSAAGRESAPPTDEAPRWHALAAEEALSRLETGRDGLSAREAATRLERHGPNALRIARPVPAWRILLDQVRSLVVLLLFAAAGVAVLIGDLLEAGAIGVVLLLNTVIGFWTEWRARQAMEGLRQLQVQEAVVLRDGEERRVDARTLVPGDVVVLEAGAAVPADARLLAATELRLNEAPLTGESMPVSKRVDPVEPDVSLADRRSMVFKGTLVAAGSGRALVVGTGQATEIGRVSELVQETEEERTPLERRLDALGRRLVWLTLGVAALITGLGLVRGQNVWLMVETGIALAIAAVPEGLPVVATITLAVGMRRMARRRALVRRLPAVETLGSATVICADKTGTLTAGEMTVTEVAVGDELIEVTGVGYAPEGEFHRGGRSVSPGRIPGLELLLRIGALTNRADVGREDDRWTAAGDPTEAALLVAARKAALDRERLRESYPEQAEVPFSSERKLMATFHRADDGTVAYVKGAPGVLRERSSRVVSPDGVVELDDEGRARLAEINTDLAGRGLRVLALACRDLAPDDPLDEGALHDLTFVGHVGLLDPPAGGVQETIERFHSAGVRTVMITGDQTITAEAVARDLGVLRSGDETVDGREMTRLDEAELASRVAHVGAFSRVSPEDKLRIVRAYQSGGEIVGMLGDGVNDAAALKRADIGVAMGMRGTDVAKETADVVLQDDRFETIGAAVEEGRVIFDNVRKFIFYLFSCNVSEVMVVFIAGLASLPLPLLPLQILWLNLVTDVFPALALAMEPAEPDVMRRPPRDPQAAILSRGFMTLVGSYAAMLTLATLAVFLWGLEVRGLETRHAVTLAFMTLALTQLFHVFNARTPEPILFTRRLLQNRWVWGAVALTIALQLAAVYMPVLSRVLDTHPLGLADWGAVLAGSLAPLLAGQVWKTVLARRRAGERIDPLVANGTA